MRLMSKPFRNGVAAAIVCFAASSVSADPPRNNPRDEAIRQSVELQKESAASAKEKYREYRKMVRQAALEGSDWLERNQHSDGTFQYGWLPAIDEVMPGNHPLRQAGAAALLARASVRLKHPSFNRAAVVAIRALLDKTTEIDPNRPEERRSSLSPTDANPVGMAALLLWAIAELDDPPDEIALEGERLANFLRRRQRPDGSVNVSNSFRDDGDDPPQAPAYYPGEALYAIIRSHERKPADWKLGMLRKALPHYRNYWQDNPHEAFPPWICSAFGEAYLITGDDAFADFVVEVADWTLALQHLGPREIDRGWQGGFGSFQQGQFLATEPGITTASFCEGLVDAYRVATKRKDSTRAQQYRRALDNAAPFLLTLQYTPERTRHFVDSAAKRYFGAFRASISDGALRIDHNQHATNALLQYLEFVAVAETTTDKPSAN
jgi:hypothetical protein